MVRALTLLDSLRRCGGEFKLYALCLDEQSLFVIQALGKDNVVPIQIAELENYDPELAATKATRSLIEYYFTITPCWPLYLFDTFKEIEQITYLDADLYFFSDPETVFAEINKASIALSPHNFSPDHAEDIVYGKYNMGWITWRRDENGLTALKWYRESCIEWCYDRLEGDKFADQKYLEEIAGFPGAKDIKHIGVNISEWSCNNYEFTLDDNDTPLVDGEPLVCYHFQRFWVTNNKSVNTVIPERHKNPDSVVMRHVFDPYFNRLNYFLDLVRKIYPEANLEEEVRSNPFPDPYLDKGLQYSKASNGKNSAWSAASVLQARVDQWNRVQSSLQSDSPIGSTVGDHQVYISFGYVLGLAAQGKPKISILDWGGAFGHFLLYGKRLFPRLNIDYTCKELPLLAEQGRLANREAKFVDNDEAAFSRCYDLVFANSSLQYSDDWVETLIGLVSATSTWLFISRIHLVSNIVSQIYFDRAYESDVQVWAINRNDFLETSRSCGLVKRHEMHTFENLPSPFGELEGRSFLFEKLN